MNETFFELVKNEWLRLTLSDISCQFCFLLFSVYVQLFITKIKLDLEWLFLFHDSVSFFFRFLEAFILFVTAASHRHKLTSAVQNMHFFCILYIDGPARLYVMYVKTKNVTLDYGQ